MPNNTTPADSDDDMRYVSIEGERYRMSHRDFCYVVTPVASRDERGVIPESLVVELDEQRDGVTYSVLRLTTGDARMLSALLLTAAEKADAWATR